MTTYPRCTVVFLALSAMVATACDPVWTLRATVRSPADAPLEDAALTILCPEESADAVAIAAALTDRRGEATIGGGAYLPPGCSITVARPGYRVHTLTLEQLCRVPLSECDREKSAEVTLVPLGAAP